MKRVWIIIIIIVIIIIFPPKKISFQKVTFEWNLAFSKNEGLDWYSVGEYNDF